MVLVKKPICDQETASMDAFYEIVNVVSDWVENDHRIANIINCVPLLVFGGAKIKDEKWSYPEWKEPSVVIEYAIDNGDLLLNVVHLDREALIQDVQKEDEYLISEISQDDAYYERGC